MHRVYFPDYDERWRRLIELTREHAAPVPYVLDLGCGPGTLTRRLAAGLPGAAVVGIDADSLLIMLARRATPPEQQVLFHCARLGTPGTHALLDRLGPFDAIVSSAFMHYFSPSDLARLHRSLRALLAPDGILITAERFADDSADEQPTDAAGVNPWRRWWTSTHELLDRPAPLGTEGADPPPSSVAQYLDIAAHADLQPFAVTHTGASHVIALRRVDTAGTRGSVAESSIPA